MSNLIGYVVIGRNEGERLKKCLLSIPSEMIVYVDSGSSDGSVEWASSVGAECVELDMSKPFTAARARNAGITALLNKHPSLLYVMFMDGDCILAEGWETKALEVIGQNVGVGVVCGRRKERFPEHSIYNQICDIEWNTPIGEASACGGDALYCVDVFAEVGGFDDAFIAGEEPELCFRIRELGHKILRIDQIMTFHDADIHQFSQWWRRSKRSGYAYWLNAHKHGFDSSERFKIREVANILIWGAMALLTILLTIAFRNFLPVVIFGGVWVIQLVRLMIFFVALKEEYGIRAWFGYAVSLLIGKAPQFLGVAYGMYKTFFSKPHKLVEYK